MKHREPHDDDFRDKAVHMLSHELRNCVASVQSFSYLLYRKVGTDDENARDYYEKINAKIDLLTTHLNRLIDLSYIMLDTLPLSSERFPVDAVLREIADSSSFGGKKRNVMITADEEIIVQTDKKRAEQIIRGLAALGFERLPDEGIVTIHAKRSGSFAIIRIQGSGAKNTINPGDDRYADAKRRFLEEIAMYVFTEIAHAIGGTLEIKSGTSSTAYELSLSC
jgi:signal transduction histidine kinase